MPLRLSTLLAMALVACAVLAGSASAQDEIHIDSKVGKAPKQPAKARLRPIRPVLGQTKARIGIADQNETVFADDRFRGLGVRYARRSVPWDALQYTWARDDLDRWLLAARSQGVEPLVTFARSRARARSRIAPKPEQFQRAFRAFRQRYPFVRTFSAWNEANHCGERTCRKPELVARYYRIIKAGCRGCKVLAADLLDMPNMVSWVLAFKKAARQEPKYWGLHNYVSANRFDVRATTALLQNTAGEVWITETGGLVARRNRSAIRLRQGKAHAVRVTRFVFQSLARLSPRVSRVYLYHWKSKTAADTWDSAFIGADDRERPALGILRGFLRSRSSASG